MYLRKQDSRSIVISHERKLPTNAYGYKSRLCHGGYLPRPIVGIGRSRVTGNARVLRLVFLAGFQIDYKLYRSKMSQFCMRQAWTKVLVSFCMMTNVVCRDGPRLLGRPSGHSTHYTQCSDHFSQGMLKLQFICICVRDEQFVKMETSPSLRPCFFGCMKTSILHSESYKSSYWHCIDHSVNF